MAVREEVRAGYDGIRADLQRDEDDRLKELDRAQQARLLLEDPLFKAAIQALRDQAVRGFADCDPRDHLALMAAQSDYKAVETMINRLLRHVETGTLAKTQLSEIRDKLKAYDRKVRGWARG